MTKIVRTEFAKNYLDKWGIGSRYLDKHLSEFGPVGLRLKSRLLDRSALREAEVGKGMHFYGRDARECLLTYAKGLALVNCKIIRINLSELAKNLEWQNEDFMHDLRGRRALVIPDFHKVSACPLDNREKYLVEEHLHWMWDFGRSLFVASTVPWGGLDWWRKDVLERGSKYVVACKV